MIARPDIGATLWRALHAATEPLDAAALAARGGCARRTANLRLQRWHKAGLLTRTDEKAPRFAMTGAGRGRAGPPAFTRDGHLLEPVTPTLALVWRAARALGKRGAFDVPQLALVAGTSNRYAHDCVNRLSRAGYLRLAVRHENWCGKPGAYRLVRDTGPRPPRIDVRPGLRVLIDGNTGERIDISPRTTRARSSAVRSAADGGVG